MKELWPLEENKYIFLFYGETVPLRIIVGVVAVSVLSHC